MSNKMRSVEKEEETSDSLAFVVCLNNEISTNDIVGIDNCEVLLGIDGLRARMSNANSSDWAKPVIVLSSHYRPRFDLIEFSLESFWRYDGKCTLSSVKCTYDCKDGRLQIDPVTEIEIQRIAMLASIIAMPVHQALSLNTEFPLFVPAIGFTLCLPNVNLDEKEINALKRLYSPEVYSLANFEKLARYGQLDHKALLQINLPTGSSAMFYIQERLMKFEDLKSALREKGFSKTSVESTIALIAGLRSELPYLRSELSDFLESLSKRPEVLIEIPSSHFDEFIRLARDSNKANEIANNIGIVAADLCKKYPKKIPALFELLASTLPPERLNVIYLSAFSHFEHDFDATVILLESLKKFGDILVLPLLLLELSRDKPAWLKKGKLLRAFTPVLASPWLHTIVQQVGEETVSSIRARVKTVEHFHDAVRANDRAAAKLLLSQESESTRGNFVPWMNSLRSLSYELRRIGISVSDLQLPGAELLEGRQIAAVRFSDRDAIVSMLERGEFDNCVDLKAVALHVIGDNNLLNEIISQKFLQKSLRPFTIEGISASSVFGNAARTSRSTETVNGPLVSVIMTAYNPDMELLRIALDSIEAQTWRNWELLLVDDASDSQTSVQIRELIRNYGRARLIRLATNSGPYAGRNAALRFARGEFIAIHDADDWAHPQRLAAQITHLQENPELHAITSEHVRINRSGDIALESQFRVFGDGPMTTVFRKQVFSQIGEFAAVRTRGDLEMRARIAAYYGWQANGMLPLPLSLCFADSKTHSHSMKSQKEVHIKLFHNNVADMSALNSLYRDGIKLTKLHQIQVPRMLRAPTAIATECDL